MSPLHLLWLLPLAALAGFVLCALLSVSALDERTTLLAREVLRLTEERDELLGWVND